MKHNIDPDKIDKKAFENAKKASLQESDDIMDNASFLEMFEDLVPEELTNLDGMTKEDSIKLCLKLILAKIGVTPDEYKEAYDLYRMLCSISKAEDSRINGGDDLLFQFMEDDRYSKPFNTYTPMPDAADKTLVLKVQLKGVTKPPMWREVEVPADYTFSLLHEIIQIIVGLDDCHLWQFNKKAYDRGLCIGESRKDDNYFDYGLHHTTDEAYETPLTKYLAKKNDTLEYVYDFGDDWIFTVKVQNVLDRKCEKPVCTKFKSDLNAFEDLGGPYVYEQMRAYVDPSSDMTTQERNETENHFANMFSSKSQFKDWVMNLKFNMKEVNEALAEY